MLLTVTNRNLEEQVSVQPMFGKIRKLRKENEKYISLRNSLLPKLKTGELDISDF